MGLFSKHGLIGKFTNHLGKNIGNFINDVTGITQSAKQQYEYNSALQKQAQDYTTWQMSNAHQLETQDMKAAGLNPSISGAGSGAGGTVSPGATGAGQNGGDPISMISNLINTMNNSARTENEINKTNADIVNQTNKTNSDIQKNNAEIEKALKDAGYTDAQIEYYKTYGVFPGATESDTYSGLGFSRTKTRPIGSKSSAKNVKTNEDIEKEIERDFGKIKFWKKS